MRLIRLIVAGLGLVLPAIAQAQLLSRIEAGALGGNVRTKPEIDSERVAKLKPGESVVLVENSCIVLMGYPWFKI